MNEINKEIIFKWIEAAFNTYIKPHYDDIKKNKDETDELKKKLDEDIESRKNWEDAWVKVSNSYLKWNDELKSLSEDFLTLASLLKKILNTPEVVTIPTILNPLTKMDKSKFLADIIALNKQMESESEKELPKHENGLNHMHGINSETSVSDSKLSDLCKECGGSRMGERMMHNDWCSQCTTSTTVEKLPETIYPDTPVDIKVDWIVDKLRKKGYNIIDNEKTNKIERNCTTCKSIYDPEVCITCNISTFSNWSLSKRLTNKPSKSLIKEQYKKQMERQ